MSDITIPRITEKRYLLIPPTALTANGTVDGLITIANTYGFKVGQTVLFKQASTFFEAKVQKVTSETQFIVINAAEAVTTKNKLDMSSFLSGTTTVELREKPRPGIDLLEIQRQVYEEEPTVALRHHSVDWLGRSYDANNPMPISGDITTSSSNKMEKYVLHEIDEPNNSTTYIGKEDVTGTWLLQLYAESGKTTTITYANISNNGGQATLTAAWTNRATLTYDLIENLTGV